MNYVRTGVGERDGTRWEVLPLGGIELIEGIDVGVGNLEEVLRGLVVPAGAFLVARRYSRLISAK